HEEEDDALGFTGRSDHRARGRAGSRRVGEEAVGTEHPRQRGGAKAAAGLPEELTPRAAAEVSCHLSRVRCAYRRVGLEAAVEIDLNRAVRTADPTQSM